MADKQQGPDWQAIAQEALTSVPPGFWQRVALYQHLKGDTNLTLTEIEYILHHMPNVGDLQAGAEHLHFSRRGDEQGRSTPPPVPQS